MALNLDYYRTESVNNLTVHRWMFWWGVGESVKLADLSNYSISNPWHAARIDWYDVVIRLNFKGATTV